MARININKVLRLSKREAQKAFPQANILRDAEKLTKSEWLQHRRAGIGGSEVAAIIGGLTHWNTRYSIWVDKTSTEPPVEKESPVLEWGTRIEPVIRQKIADSEGAGRVFIVPWMMNSKENPFMCADIDGVELRPDGEWWGIEIKTHCKVRADDNSWETTIPDYYMTQVQHYMIVTGLKKFRVVCLLNGSTYVEYIVDAVPELQKAILEAEKKFWRQVETRTPPEVDGEEATSKALAQFYRQREEETVDFSDNEEFLGLLNEYEEAAEAEKAAAQRKANAGNHIKNMMGSKNRAKCGEWKTSWTITDRESLDTKRLKAENPDLVTKYTVVTPRDNGLRITTPKEL